MFEHWMHLRAQQLNHDLIWQVFVTNFSRVVMILCMLIFNFESFYKKNNSVHPV